MEALVVAVLVAAPPARAGGGKPSKPKAPAPPPNAVADKLPEGCTRLADGYGAIVAPDGKRVAYVRGGGAASLGKVRATRGTPVELWVRDLKSQATVTLPHAARPVGWADGAILLDSGVGVEPVKGAKVGKVVALPADVKAATLAWSRDGKRLAWVPSAPKKAKSAVSLLGANGKPATLSATAGLRTDQTVFLAWSPDGTRLYVNALFQAAQEVPVRRVGLVDVAADTMTVVATMPDWIGIPGLHDDFARYRDPRVEDPTIVDLEYEVPAEPRYGRQVFSGDGRVATWLAGTGWIEADAFVVEVATGEVKRVTNDGELKWSPALDPTGRRLAFLTADNVGLREGFKQPRLRVLDLLSGEPTEIALPTPKGVPAFVAWTPDGAALTYEIRDGLKAEAFRQTIAAPKPVAADATIRALEYDVRNRIVAWLASYDVDRVHTAVHRAEDGWDPYYLPALREALQQWKDREGPVVACMVHMFELKRLRETIPDLRAALGAKLEGNRVAILEVLVAFGERDGIEELERVRLGAKDRNVRVRAAVALVRAEDDRGWPTLEATAKDGDLFDRANLCHELAKVRHPKAVDLLISLVADRRGDPRFPTLKLDLVGPAAQRALRTLTGQAFGDSVAKWTEWWNQEAKRVLPATVPDPAAAK